MASSMDHLKNSVEQFGRRKEECLAFLGETADMMAEWEKNFAPAAAPKAEAGADAARKENKGFGAQKQDGPAPLVALSTESVSQIREKIGKSSLKILIVGQFKQGKSTLVNALLGEDVLPAYSTPCTAVITELEYGKEKRDRLFFRKEIKELPESLPEDIRSKIRKHLDAHAADDEGMEVPIEDLEDFLVIPDPAQDQTEAVGESPYARCVLEWPLALCRNQTSIIDSPGLNEHQARDRTTLEYVPQADMIIHVLNSLQLFGEPDQKFYDQIKNLGHNSIIFACNRFDQLNNDKERDRIRPFAWKLLEDKTSLGKDGIFFLSAFKALSGRGENDEELFRSSGFPEFEMKIGDIIANERTRIKLGSSMSQACLMMKEFISGNGGPESQIRILDQDVRKISENYEREKPKIRDFEERLKKVDEKIDQSEESLRENLSDKTEMFLKKFITEDIKNIIMGAKTSDTEFFSPFESRKRINSELQEALSEGFSRKLAEWADSTMNPMIQKHMERLGKDLAWDFRQLSEQYESIANGIGLQGGENYFQKLHDSVENDAPIGAAIGAGMGAGGWILGALVLGGTIGWIGAAVVGVLSGIMNFFIGADGVDTIKKKFIDLAIDKFADQADDIYKKILGSVGEKIVPALKEIQKKMHHQIESMKSGIEHSIELMKAQEGDIQKHKEELAAFATRFTALQKRGEALSASLNAGR